MNISDLKAADLDTRAAQMRELANRFDELEPCEAESAGSDEAEGFVPSDVDWLAAVVVIINDEEPDAPAAEHVAEHIDNFLKMRGMGFEAFEVAQHSAMLYRKSLVA